MSAAERLYTPEVLGLAAALADYPLVADFTLRGAARSPLCGSVVDLGLSLDREGRIDRIGLKAHACAIGQAAAAIFAASAKGRNRRELQLAQDRIRAWLDQPAAALPSWPGMAAIAAARAYPARHGAILLPWRAALDTLP